MDDPDAHMVALVLRADATQLGLRIVQQFACEFSILDSYGLRSSEPRIDAVNRGLGCRQTPNLRNQNVYLFLFGAGLRLLRSKQQENERERGHSASLAW